MPPPPPTKQRKIYYHVHFKIHLQLKEGNALRNRKTPVTLKTFHLILFPSCRMYIDISFIYLTKIALVVLFHPWCAKSKKPIKLVHCCESLKLIRWQKYLENCSEPTTDWPTLVSQTFHTMPSSSMIPLRIIKMLWHHASQTNRSEAITQTASVAGILFLEKYRYFVWKL